VNLLLKQLYHSKYEICGLICVGWSTLAVAFAFFIHVKIALCALYDFDCLRHLVEFGDFEEPGALATSYPTVGGAAVE
jgi:hypothetical protein